MPDLSRYSDQELQLMQQRMADAEAQQVSGQATHYTPGDQSWREYDPARGMNPVAQLGVGYLGGIVGTAEQAGNMVGAVPRHTLEEHERLMGPLNETPAGTIGGFAGETAATMPIAGATELAPVVRELPMALRGAVSGAGVGAIQAGPDKRWQGAEWGAVGGAAPGTVGFGGRLLARGLARTPEAQFLIDQGVRLPPWMLEPDSWINHAAENIRGYPVVGPGIMNAENRAWADTQRAIAQEAGAPGFKMPASAQTLADQYKAAVASYKPLYDAASGFPVTPHVWSTGQNMPLSMLFDAAATRGGIGATATTRERVKDFLQGQLQAFQQKATSQGGWKSENLIELRSRISEEMRNAGVDQEGRTYRELLTAARNNVTQSLESQLPYEAAASLRTATAAYPKLAILRDAMKAGGDQINGFTPAQFSQAVRRSADIGEYAGGGGMFRDWSSTGRQVFTERAPRTGMSLETAAPAAAAGLLGVQHPAIGVPAAIAGGIGFGTEAGRSFLRGTTPPQRWLQSLAGQVNSRVSIPPQIPEFAGLGARAGLANALAQAKARSMDMEQAEMAQ